MTVPAIGQDPWGETLNAYLTELEDRIAALEAKPEYVFNSYEWKFSSAPPPAGVAELRLNNTNAVLATSIDVRKIDADGADRTPIFSQLSLGDKIRINDWDNATIFHNYTVSGALMIGATNAIIPVTWVSGNGVLPTTGAAKINVAFLVALSM